MRRPDSSARITSQTSSWRGSPAGAVPDAGVAPGSGEVASASGAKIVDLRVLVRRAYDSMEACGYGGLFALELDDVSARVECDPAKTEHLLETLLEIALAMRPRGTVVFVNLRATPSVVRTTIEHRSHPLPSLVWSGKAGRPRAVCLELDLATEDPFGATGRPGARLRILGTESKGCRVTLEQLPAASSACFRRWREAGEETGDD